MNYAVKFVGGEQLCDPFPVRKIDFLELERLVSLELR
jgi:hypothetical protein